MPEGNDRLSVREIESQVRNKNPKIIRSGERLLIDIVLRLTTIKAMADPYVISKKVHMSSWSQKLFS